MLIWLVLGLCPAIAQGGAKPTRPLIVSIFNVGTQLPGSGTLGVFSQPVHPGLGIGTEFFYRKGAKNQWLQTARVGVLHHRLAQTAVQLYSEFGYRRKIWRGTGAELRLGGGYLHSFPAVEVFKIKDGAYSQKANIGRAQAMAGGAFGLSYAMAADWRFFLDYQFYLQMPFVKNYVPLLPNSALHIGAAFPFFNK